MKLKFALPSYCYNCKAITGTGKEKNGKGMNPTYYCKKCGNAK